MIIRDDIRSREVAAQVARGSLRERRLSEKAIRLDAFYDPQRPGEWASWRVGNVVRLTAPSAFVSGFDGPARILAAQPMEEAGLCELVLELLAEAV